MGRKDGRKRGKRWLGPVAGILLFLVLAGSLRTEEVSWAISCGPGDSAVEASGAIRQDAGEESEADAGKERAEDGTENAGERCAEDAGEDTGERRAEDAGEDTGERPAEDADGEEPVSDHRKVALTFDDGPHPVYTPRLLDGLKERNVKASFFVVGQNAEENPELIWRIQEEGHLLGNHTYSHVQLTGITEEEACDELTRTSQVVEEITGEQLIYVRPPFGSWNDQLDCDILMIPVFWSVDSRDWTTTNVSEIVRRVVTQTKEDDIILMHDYYSTSVDAALKIVDQMLAMGYEFVTADELIVN